MPFVQRALRGHVNRLKKAGGVLVTYQGIDGLSLTLTMAPALRRTESVTDNNVLVDKELHDWLCNVDDLPRTPRRGDVIISSGVHYRVIHPGGGREFDHLDPWVFGYRIHTILLDGAPAPPPVIPPPIEPPPVISYPAYAPPDGYVYCGPDGTPYGPPN